MHEGRRESRLFRLATYVVLILGATPILLPLYWTLSASLKSRERIMATPPDWLPVFARDTLAVDGQTLRVSVFDDGSLAGTGVARAKMIEDAQYRYALPLGSLERVSTESHMAEIGGVLRRVEPRGPTAPDGTLEVVLVGSAVEVAVPIGVVQRREETATFWPALGVEIRVESDGAASAGPADRVAADLVRIHWREAPRVAVAPSRVRGAGGVPRVRWRGHDVPVAIVERVDAANVWIVTPVCPSDGVLVPRHELRRESRVRWFVPRSAWPEAMDHAASRPASEPSAYEVRPLARDEAAGTVVVERPDLPRTARIPAQALQTSRRDLFYATVLGQRREVQPRADALPDNPAAPVSLYVPGTITIAADRVQSERRLEPRWANFSEAWREQTFDLYAVNTLFIAALVVLGTVLSCGLVGYAFARLEFRGRDTLFLLVLATMMVPAQVTSIPTFVLFVKLGWIDTYLPLIVPHFLAFSAFFVFLFRQYMLTIPRDLEDSARIDGCGPLQTWWLIMMPLSRPIVVTTAVFAFIGVWNDFLAPLLYINSDEKQTVALGLQSFKSAYADFEPQLLMAATVMMIIPAVVLFFFAQRAFIRGVVVTGVKG